MVSHTLKPTSRGSQGFTILELMTVVALIAILTAIAAPSYKEYIERQKVKNAAEDIFLQLLYAKSEAVVTNSPIYLKNNNSDDTWESGWIVTNDAGTDYSDCSSDASTCLKVTSAKPGIVVNTYLNDALDNSIDAVTYNRSGRISGGRIAFEVCDTNSGVVIAKRIVSVQLSGQPKIEVGGNCP